ncbi:MAG TPA: class I tRNA ligase family protein, partial [Clostridia bacterium]|nr:class I tRNA ligase family protein [Clostridia bacterium]
GGFDALWSPEDPEGRHYYVHGKDNIPFHTLILPALLLAHGGGWHLPDRIVSSEYLTLEGRKISTSKGWAIWAEDLASQFDPDSIRYFLIANGPEKRDTDFSFREFVNSHNGELLGAYGNFIHRTLVFVRKYLGGRVPDCGPDEAQLAEADGLFETVGRLLEQTCLKEALDAVFALVRSCNRYFDRCRPWETRTSDPADCERVLHTCVQLAANLAVLLGPFLPFSSAKLRAWLNVAEAWEPARCPAGLAIPEPAILFARIERDQAAAARSRLLPTEETAGTTGVGRD